MSYDGSAIEKVAKLEARVEAHENELGNLRLRLHDIAGNVQTGLNASSLALDLRDSLRRLEDKMDKSVSSMNTKVEAIEQKVVSVREELVKIATKFSVVLGIVVVLIEVVAKVLWK